MFQMACLSPRKIVVLGLCLGCEIYAALVRRGWIAKDKAFEVCSDGACDVEARR